MNFDNPQSSAMESTEGISIERGSCQPDSIDRVSLFEDYGEVRSNNQSDSSDTDGNLAAQSELDFGSQKELFGCVSTEQISLRQNNTAPEPRGVISDSSSLDDRFATSSQWNPDGASSGAAKNYLDMGTSTDLYKKEMFDQLDLNGSGSLSSLELTQGAMNDLLKQDTNDDGYLDRNEAREGARERGVHPLLAELGFHLSDTDRNGKIDSREMQRVAEGTSNLTMFFGDRNRDGRLSYEEFAPLVPDKPPTPPRPQPDVPPTPPEPQPDVQPEPPEPQPDVPPEPVDSIEEARESFTDSLENYLTPEEGQRLEKMMAEFEERGSERVEAKVAGGQDRDSAEKEWNEKIKKTYKELDDMVSSDSPDAVYDKATRAKLAENAMYLFMNPANENQGQHGTCWVESQINLIGLGKHPDKMANLLNQVATTGSYTDINGREHKIPDKLLQISREEASWTVSNAGNGYRSPVGAIFDRTLSYCNNGRTDGGTNGGTVREAANAISLACGESGKMIQIRDNYLTPSDIARITSRDARQAMLEDGGVILVGPGHMFSSRLVNEDGNWQIIGDNQWGARNDQLIGELTNLNSWDVRQTRKRYVPDHGSMYIANDRTILSRSSVYSSDNFSYGNYQGQRLQADSSRIYDDTNDMIEGPLGYRSENNKEDEGENRDRQHRRDRRFNRERYLENQRRLRDEWRKMRRS